MNCETGLPIPSAQADHRAGLERAPVRLEADVYTYVWKTETAWMNTCRMLTVKFADGTQAHALFRFVK